MGQLYTMSTKEFGRLEILQKLIRHEMSQAKASEYLGIGVRQIQRLLINYRHNGSTSIISRKRGKASNNKLPVQVKELAMAIIKRSYSDFGPTLAAEKLRENHDCKISIEKTLATPAVRS